VCEATLLPHCGHLFNCGAFQRSEALRVRNRILDVLRFGTPIRADHESRRLAKGNRPLSNHRNLVNWLKRADLAHDQDVCAFTAQSQ